MNTMYPLCCAAFILFSIVKADQWCCDQPANEEVRIARLIAFNNHNNDSIIDVADIEYDLRARYDNNHDNKTSKMEYVLARNCLLGESFSLADTVFGIADKNKDGFITAGELAQSPIGKPPIPVAVFEARMRAMLKNGGAIVGR